MSTQRRRRHQFGGFTLIELLVVIALLGTLAAIAIPTFLQQRNSGFHAQAAADLRNTATAEEAALLDTGSYVTSLTALRTEGLRRTAGITLGIGAATNGYCEVAGHEGTYWWFDSVSGGMQHDTTSNLTPPASADGACASDAPASVS